jgi:hypothetical protein
VNTRNNSALPSGDASAQTSISSSISIQQFLFSRVHYRRGSTMPRKARTWPVRIEGPRSPCDVQNQAAPNRVQPGSGITLENSRFSIRQSPLTKTESSLSAIRRITNHLLLNLFTFAALGMSLPVCAQPNSLSKTNAGAKTKPVPTAADIKRDAIQRVNDFWKIERDHVREETCISLKNQIIDLSESSNLRIDVTCYVNVDRPVPAELQFHFASNSDDWEFLKYSAFIVNYDGTKKDFGELKVSGDVLPDARVFEQMNAWFTYEEFHQMAFAKRVMFNLGTHQNGTILPATRAKWQILCNYFDLIQAEQKAKTEKEEQ